MPVSPLPGGTAGRCRGSQRSSGCRRSMAVMVRLRFMHLERQSLRLATDAEAKRSGELMRLSRGHRAEELRSIAWLEVQHQYLRPTIAAADRYRDLLKRL